ncbi:hypothetical protein QTO34_000825 [Cnephaeus nilssonii]|uniref:Uncharacterized protein n=1 Tax=Cnephaeus nilssonii TaxID=3371016 RepID=A0AA40LV07_CNENI|nr:hypothetical protein QTO34_000825 [Eptesicus nilssonii]
MPSCRVEDGNGKRKRRSSSSRSINKKPKTLENPLLGVWLGHPRAWQPPSHLTKPQQLMSRGETLGVPWSPALAWPGRWWDATRKVAKWRMGSWNFEQISFPIMATDSRHILLLSSAPELLQANVAGRETDAES